jgi:predicted DNA-binding protein
MGKIDEIKIERLDRIVTVRMTDEDYNALQSISENKRSNVSRIIRTITSMVIEMVKENNCKV